MIEHVARPEKTHPIKRQVQLVDGLGCGRTGAFAKKKYIMRAKKNEQISHFTEFEKFLINYRK